MTGPNTTPDFVRKAYILQYIADGAEIVSLAGGRKLPERLPVNDPRRQYFVLDEHQEGGGGGPDGNKRARL